MRKKIIKNAPLNIIILILVLFLNFFCIQISFATNLSEAQELIKTKFTDVNKYKSIKVLCANKLYCKSNLVLPFYLTHNFNPVWLSEDGKLNNSAKILVHNINFAYLDGLDPAWYHVKQIHNLKNSLNKIEDIPQSPLKAKLIANIDVTLTDAFMIYANHLSNGVNYSKKMFEYWSNDKKKIDYVELLNEALKNNTLQEIITNTLTPNYFMYSKLKAKLFEYQRVKNNGGWEKIPYGEDLKKGDRGDRVLLLQRRLLVSGELENIKNLGDFDDATEDAVIQYQQNNGLYEDGVVSRETLDALNVSTIDRVRQIELNLDKMRFLPRDLGDEYIMVNIPEYSLNLIKGDNSVLHSDVAVGNAKNQSCILQSKITYLVLNPYWNIPTNIAITEVWPAIKKNPDIIKQNNIHVFENLGKDVLKEVDINNIKWSELSLSDFKKYKFRQDPSDNNSLGKVKFIFKNPCHIYLHDSNKLEVFDLYRRDFSHGCVRVSDSIELANYILKTQKGWTDAEILELLNTKRSKIINLPKPINLYIVYFTAWVNDNDWVEFRNDIYNLDKLYSARN